MEEGTGHPPVVAVDGIEPRVVALPVTAGEVQGDVVVPLGTGYRVLHHPVLSAGSLRRLSALCFGVPEVGDDLLPEDADGLQLLVLGERPHLDEAHDVG